MTAAPADSGESEITTTFLPESTSTTTLLETSTTVIDAQHNELDAKFTNGDEKLTTTLDVDKKIESIEEDSDVRLTSIQPIEKAVTEETNDKTTLNAETTIEKKAEEFQEPKNNKKLERFVTETSGKEESTTMKIDPTSSTIATRVVLQEKPEDKSVTENREMAERAQALMKIKKMLRAHVLRAVLTILNEARKRKIQEQYPSESQVVGKTIHMSGSECDCREKSDFDDDKVIAFDKNLQHYAYIDKVQENHVSLSNIAL